MAFEWSYGELQKINQTYEVTEICSMGVKPIKPLHPFTIQPTNGIVESNSTINCKVIFNPDDDFVYKIVLMCK